MMLWQFMGEFDISISRENSPAVVDNNKKEADPAIQSHDRRSLSNAMIQDTIEHVGRQQHIPGGRMVLPSGFGASSGELVEVAGFDMDVFLVTNLQYVDFLNHNRARIDQHILRLPDNFVTCLRIQISIDKYFKQLDKISEIAYRRKYIDKVKSP